MRTRMARIPLVTIAALGVLMVTTAGAQTSTGRRASTSHIPVRKAPTDTSVTRESPPAATPAPAPAATAPVAQTEPPPRSQPAPLPMRRVRYGTGFYVGLGGGAGIPTQAIRNAYGTGYTINVPIGWDAPYSPLGFRVNLGYTRFDARTSFRNPLSAIPGATLAVADPKVWSAIADLKLRSSYKGWHGHAASLYAVGGGGVNHFRDYSNSFARTNPEFNNGSTPPTTESLTRAAVNAGGGIALGIRATEVFLESRYVTAFMPNERASYVPVVLGVNFF